MKQDTRDPCHSSAAFLRHFSNCRLSTVRNPPFLRKTIGERKGAEVEGRKMAMWKKTGVRNRDATSTRSTPGGRVEAEIRDHWAFLEEIEAPMWADLEMESQNVNEDADDAWFQITHPLHQMSSRRFKSSILHIAIQDKPENRDIFSRSPCLPDSVSRSRGKHYSSKRIASKDLEIASSELHPIRNFSRFSSKISPASKHDLAKPIRAVISSSSQTRSQSKTGIFIGDPHQKKSSADLQTSKGNPRLSGLPQRSSNSKMSTSETKNTSIKSTIKEMPSEGTKKKPDFKSRKTISKDTKILKALSSSSVRRPLSVLNGVDRTKKAIGSTANSTKNPREAIPDRHGDSKGRKKTDGTKMTTVAAKYLR